MCYSSDWDCPPKAHMEYVKTWSWHYWYMLESSSEGGFRSLEVYFLKRTMRPWQFPSSLFKLVNSLPLPYIPEMVDYFVTVSKAAMPLMRDWNYQDYWKTKQTNKQETFSLTKLMISGICYVNQKLATGISEFHRVSYKCIKLFFQLRKKVHLQMWFICTSM